MTLITAALIVLPVLYSVYQSIDAFLEDRRTSIANIEGLTDDVETALRHHAASQASLADAVAETWTQLRDARRLPAQAAIMVERHGRQFAFASSGVIDPSSLPRADSRIVRRHLPDLDIDLQVGLPLQPWRWLSQGLMVAVLMPTLMLVIAVVTVWIATDHLLTRHVEALAAVMREHRRGGTVPQVNMAGAPRELRELAGAFEDMARSLETREQDLLHLLEVRERLLREVHHRVRNNLQVVTSLLSLEGRAAPDEAAKVAISHAVLRIRALALAHRDLFLEEPIASVAVDVLLPRVVELVSAHHGWDDLQIEVAELAPGVVVDVDGGGGLALLLVELLDELVDADEGRPIEVRLLRDGTGSSVLFTREDACERVVDRIVSNLRLRLLAAQCGGTLQGWNETSSVPGASPRAQIALHLQTAPAVATAATRDERPAAAPAEKNTISGTGESLQLLSH